PPVTASTASVAMMTLAKRLEPRQAAAATQRLVKMMESAQQNDLITLAWAVRILAPRLEPQAAAAAMPRVVKVMETAPPVTLATLAGTVTTLAARLEPRGGAGHVAGGPPRGGRGTGAA